MSDYRAAPHMLRFQCTGSACEDTCCKAWEIQIYDDDVERLERGLGKVEAEALVHHVPDGRGGTIRVLKKLDNGTCSKLDDHQLCTLHAAHGEAVLPAICHNYPRAVRRVGVELELTGKLSCPEVARLALLGDEATLTEAPPDRFERLEVRQAFRPEEDPVPYHAPFREVRDTLIELCVTPGFSLASRLYFVTHLAERLGGFYHRDIATLDKERLASELESIKNPDVQNELHQRRGASSPMDGLALELAQGLVYSRIASSTALERLARKAFGTHATAAGVPEQADLLKQIAAIKRMQMWHTHQVRRAWLGPEKTARLDECVARFCRAYWLQDWYRLSPTLMQHAMLLVLRVTVIRFLLIAHPDVRRDMDDATLDKVVVEVCYTVARAYDHTPELRKVLATMLQKREMLTVDHAAALLKL